MFRSKCRWIEKGERPTKYFSTWKNKTIKERLLLNFDLRTRKFYLKKMEF